MTDVLEILDMSLFPRIAMIGSIELSAEIERIARPAYEAMSAARAVQKHTSFGYAVTYPNASAKDFNNPEKFLLLVGGWGPQWERYAANAVRKIRPVLRSRVDSLWLTVNKLSGAMPDAFDDEVASANADGTFSWGDFPYGGAYTVDLIDETEVIVAVSCLAQEEDDTASRFVGGIVNQTLVRAHNLLAK